MSSGKNGGRRAWLVLALLCLVIWGQSSALVFQHHQHRATDHCCLLCHAGPLPLLQATLSTAATPALWAAWLAPAPQFDGAYDALISTSSSRAPPTGFAARIPGGPVPA